MIPCDRPHCLEVEMDLPWKARWVFDGNTTADESYLTYAGVVSRESVQILMIYAALNGLDVAAVMRTSRHLVLARNMSFAGEEFGLENVGKLE